MLSKSTGIGKSLLRRFPMEVLFQPTLVVPVDVLHDCLLKAAVVPVSVFLSVGHLGLEPPKKFSITELSWQFPFRDIVWILPYPFRMSPNSFLWYCQPWSLWNRAPFTFPSPAETVSLHPVQQGGLERRSRPEGLGSGNVLSSDVPPYKLQLLLLRQYCHVHPPGNPRFL